MMAGCLVTADFLDIPLLSSLSQEWVELMMDEVESEEMKEASKRRTIVFFKVLKMLEGAVSENYVHRNSDIPDRTPTKTMDAEDTMERI